MDSEKNDSPVTKWAERVDWKRRVKAVCKPCWELKYCPYGPLVEDFPLKPVPDEQSCRIFGHDCPVFSMAEPFTETKELRRIDRTILRKTMIRVVKRDNGVCQICRKNIPENNYEFDHVIPWSKGGSSDENNIRLLCKRCNRKRQANYEDSLVSSITEHFKTNRIAVDFELVEALLKMIPIGMSLMDKNRRLPNSDDFKHSLMGINEMDSELASIFSDMFSLFRGDKPTELTQIEFEALKYRWGFSDQFVHSISEIKRMFNLSAKDFFEVELKFMDTMGWTLKSDSKSIKAWAET